MGYSSSTKLRPGSPPAIADAAATGASDGYVVTTFIGGSHVTEDSSVVS